MNFAPFKNESDAVTLGDLKIENREDHIAIYGRLAVTRDRAGLEAAKALKELFGKDRERAGKRPRSAGQGCLGGAAPEGEEPVRDGLTSSSNPSRIAVLITVRSGLEEAPR